MKNLRKLSERPMHNSINLNFKNNESSQALKLKTQSGSSLARPLLYTDMNALKTNFVTDQCSLSEFSKSRDRALRKKVLKADFPICSSCDRNNAVDGEEKGECINKILFED